MEREPHAHPGEIPGGSGIGRLIWRLGCGIACAAIPTVLSAGADTCGGAATLQVERFYNYSKLTYSIADPASVRAARVEHWRGTARVDQLAVDIVPQGSAQMAGHQVGPPRTLDISVVAPGVPVFCIDECDDDNYRTDAMSIAGSPSNETYEDAAAEGDVRLVAGKVPDAVTVTGRYFTHTTRFALYEQVDLNADRQAPLPGGTVAVESRGMLPAAVIDMGHASVRLPESVVKSPGLFVVEPLDVDDDQEPSPEAHEVDLQHAFAVLVVASDSPVITSVTPPGIIAGRGDVPVVIRGRGFTNQSNVMLEPSMLRDGGNFNRILATEFISPAELRTRVPAGLKYLRDDVVSEPVVHVAVGNGRFEQSNSVAITVTPGREMAIERQPPVVETIAPFPLRPLTAADPFGVELVIRGRGFAKKMRVVVHTDSPLRNRTLSMADGTDEVALRTTFVSSRELRAWLPRSAWQWTPPSYRLVLQRGTRQCVVDVVPPEW